VKIAVAWMNFLSHRRLADIGHAGNEKRSRLQHEQQASSARQNGTPELRHHREREVIPVAAFVVGLEGVAADCYS
jgi:SpoU rRNA methylase family enzyme